MISGNLMYKIVSMLVSVLSMLSQCQVTTSMTTGPEESPLASLRRLELALCELLRDVIAASS